LTIFLAILAVARLKGRTVKWRQVAGIVSIYVVLIFLTSYFVVEGPKLGSYIIAELATAIVVYYPTVIALHGCIYLPFIKATNDERNTYMVQQIIDAAEQEGYTDVCVVSVPAISATSKTSATSATSPAPPPSTCAPGTNRQHGQKLDSLE